MMVPHPQLKCQQMLEGQFYFLQYIIIPFPVIVYTFKNDYFVLKNAHICIRFHFFFYKCSHIIFTSCL